MLYLAEVQKQKSGFMGGAGKAEIKLLAFQRADQSWNPVQGEEVIPAEEASNMHSGTLVLVDLNANRQVQRLQEAGRPLVGILQNFSRLLDKFKRQEEEIEQWKQSLTYQSQEMNRRNMEMEARLEQLQQMETEFKQLEARHQELKLGQEEAQRLRQEIESNRHDLEAAWEHLRGEQRLLASQHSAILDESQARQIEELITHLPDSVLPAKSVQEQLNYSLEMLATGQSVLNQHWQQLEQQHVTIGQQQQEAESLTQALQNSFAEWQQGQNSLEQLILDLKTNTLALNQKQDRAQTLRSQLPKHEDLYQDLLQIAAIVHPINVNDKVNKEALEQMPLEQLQQVVNDLETDLAKNSRFVNDQEEELKFQKQAVEEIQIKLTQAQEHDRASLETELAEERDRYQMLNETLVGQRYNLRERKAVLREHLQVLYVRQGCGALLERDEPILDFKPILTQIEAQKQQQAEELQQLEQQIKQLQQSIEQNQNLVDSQTQAQTIKQQEWQSFEQNLHTLQATIAQAIGRVNLYQEALQPIQDNWDQLRQQLEAIACMLNQNEDQFQTLDTIRQALHNLIPNQQMAVH